MKKVAILLPIVGSGGIEVFTKNLISYIEKEYKVFVIAGIKLSNDNWNKLSPKYSLGAAFGPSRNKFIGLIKNIKKIIEIRRILDNENPDIAISMEFSSTIILKIAAFGHNTKVMAVEHSNPKYGNNSLHWILLKRIIYPWIDYTVCVSKGIAENYKYLHKNKISVIYNAISDKWYEPYVKLNKTRERYEYACYAGRLSSEKNIKFLIDSFQIVVARLPNVKLKIIGDGELKGELVNYVAEKKLVGNIDFLGYTNQIKIHIENARFLVLSSLTEGFPLVLVEALAAGVPVISTDCDYGPREIINSNNGFLIPIGDIGAYSKSMITLFEDDLEYEKMKGFSKLSVEHLAPMKIKENWLMILKTVISS